LPTPGFNDIKLSQLITAAFTLLLVLIGIGQIVLVFRQNSIIGAQSKINEKQLQTSIAQSRAFVTLESLAGEKRKGTAPSSAGVPDETDFWYFEPQIHNSGTTVTRDLSAVVFASCAFPMMIGMRTIIHCEQGNPFPKDPGERMDDKTLAASRFPLGPNVSQRIGQVGFTPRILAEMARKSDQAVYVYGAIQYRDVMPDTPVRMTKFCYAIRGDNIDPLIVHPSIDLCKHWNCADEECLDDARALAEGH
jgi:hypothetical protein